MMLHKSVWIDFWWNTKEKTVDILRLKRALLLFFYTPVSLVSWEDWLCGKFLWGITLIRKPVVIVFCLCFISSFSQFYTPTSEVQLLGESELVWYLFLIFIDNFMFILTVIVFWGPYILMTDLDTCLLYRKVRFVTNVYFWPLAFSAIEICLIHFGLPCIQRPALLLYRSLLKSSFLWIYIYVMNVDH